MAIRHALISALLAIAGSAAEPVSFKHSAGRVEISMGGQPFSNFYYGGEWAAPFLHPLRAASGTIVTRGYPVEKIAGENQDHVWHHGLWYSHGDINGVDFWRDLGPVKTGRMVAKGSPKTSGDALSAEFDLVTPAKQTLGSIAEVFRFSRSGANNVVDARIAIRADRGLPLKLGNTEEGAFGLRFADEFREDRGAVLTNAAGLVGSRKIWGKQAKWVDYSTEIKGEKVGVIMLDHPKNPKYPTYWHARGYGLNAINPFGEHDFYKDKARDGSITVPAGGEVVFRTVS